MPRTTKKEQLNMWKDRIKKATDYRKQYMVDWTYWEQIYDTNLWGRNKFGNRQTMVSPNSPVQINELDTIVNNILPKINFNYPVFDVEDMVSGNSLSALIYEVFALKLYEVLNMYNIMDEILMDSLILGSGIHKTGMQYDVEVKGENVPPEVINDMPISVNVSPINILWDYRFKDWNSLRWIAEEIWKPIEEVKLQDIYSNTKDLKPDTNSLLDAPAYIVNDYKKDSDLVRLIEIHDKYEGKIYTITMEHSEFLQYEDDYGIDIYDCLSFTMTRPKRLFGKSIVQDIEQHLVRLALHNHWMDEDSKDAGRKLYMTDSSIGKSAVDRINSDDPRPIIPIDGLMSMSGDPIREIRKSNNAFQWNATAGIIERQIRMLSGSTAQERGTHESGVETAVEAQMLMDASETRNKARALKTSIFIQKIMSKMLMLCSTYMQPERIANIIGIPIEDSNYIVPFDDMKLSVKFGSTAIEARNDYRQKLITVAQMFPDMVNRTSLFQKMATALGFGIKDQDLLINQSPNPNMQPQMFNQQQLPQTRSPF